jgi:hypothetical protein
MLSSATGSISFINGWKISQNTSGAPQVNVTDSANNTVLIFDEN